MSDQPRFSNPTAGNGASAALLRRLPQAGRAIAAAQDESAVGRALMDFAASSDLHAARLLMFVAGAERRPALIEMRESWSVDRRPAEPCGTRLPLAYFPVLAFEKANEPLIFPDLTGDPALSGEINRLMGLVGPAACAIFPLTVDSPGATDPAPAPLGALVIGRDEPSTFREETIHAWQTLVGPAAAALDHLRRQSHLKSRAIQLETAAEISHAASRILDPDKLIQRTVDLIQEQFGFYYVGLFLVDQSEETEDSERWAVLRAGTGTAKDIQLARGHKLKVGDDSTVGWCLAQGQPRIAPDVGREAKHAADPSLPETRSQVALPLISRDRVIGAMTIHSTQRDAFTKENISTLQRMVDQLASAIQNARLFKGARRAQQAYQQRSEELSALFGVSRELSSATISPREIAVTVARQMVEGGEIECSFSLLKKDGDTLEILADLFAEKDGSIHWPETETTFRLSDYPATARVIETLTPVVVQASDPDSDPAELAYMREHGLETLLIVPLTVKGRAIGVMELESWIQRDYSPEQLDLIATLANQAATALENARLFEETQQRTRQLEWLTRIESALLQADDDKEILDAITLSVDLEQFTGSIALQYIETDANQQPTGLSIVAFWRDGVIEPEHAISHPRQEIENLPTSRLWLEAPHQTIFISDLMTDPRVDERVLTYAAQQGFQALAVMPLRSGGRWQGLVTFLWPEPHTFSSDERFYLQQLLEPLSAVVTSRRAHLARQATSAESERRALLLQTAAEVSRVTSSILDPDELVQQVVDLVRERFNLYYAGLFLVDESNRWATLRAGTGKAGREMMAAGHKLEVGGGSMIGWCVAHAEARIALDVGEEAVRFDNPHLPNTRSELALPLIARGRAIGAMTIQSIRESAFSNEDISILQTMADQVANAIQNAQLLQERSQQTEELTALNLITTTVNRALEMQELLEVALKAAASALDFGGGLISLYDPVSDRLYLSSCENIPEPLVLKLERDGLAGTLCDVVFQTGEVLHISDVKQGAPVDVTGLLQNGLRAYAGTPLVHQDRLLGTLCLFDEAVHDLDSSKLSLLTAIGQQIGIGLQNARLFERARASAQETKVLNELTQALAATLSVEQVLEETYRGVSQLLDTTNFYIALYDPTEHEITFPFNVTESEIDREITVMSADEGLTGHIIRNRTGLLIREDVSGWLVEHGMEQVGEDAASWLGVPLLLGDQVLGAMAIQSYTTSRLYDRHDQDLLTTIASQTAIALQNARLFQETRSRAEELAVVNRISRAISATVDLDELLDIIHQEIDVVFQPDAFFVARYDEPADELDFMFLEDEGKRIDLGRVPLGGLSSIVITEKKPLVIRDLEKQQHQLPASVQVGGDKMAASWLGAPLMIGERVIGLLSVQSYHANIWDEKDEALLFTIADQVAAALEKTRLFKETRSRAEELAVLNELAQALATRLDVDQVLNEIYRGVSRLLDTSNFYIGLYDPEKHEVSFPLNVTESEIDREITVLSADQGITGYILRNRTSVLVKEDIVGWLEAHGMENVGQAAASWLGVPLLLGDEALGVMAIQSYTTPRLYSERDRDIFNAIASQAAIAIQNARLFEQTQQALAEVEATHRRYLQEQWQSMLSATSDRNWGYVESPHGLEATEALWTPEMEQALATGELTTLSEPFDGTEEVERNALAVPIRLRGQTIGVLDFYHEGAGRTWTKEDKALVQALAEQVALALENQRLFEQTQRRAYRERLTGEIVGKIRAGSDVQSILETAAEELGRALGVSRTLIRLGSPPDVREPTRLSSSQAHADDGDGAG